MNKPIQIVDEHGKSRGVARSPFEAIAAGQIRLLARVVITNGSGKFLLQKRAANMKMYPGCWDAAAAGHVDKDEDPHAAAYRELAEEIGLSTVSLKLQARYFADLYIPRYETSFKSYNYVYIGEYTGKLQSLVLAADEVESVIWKNRRQIEELLANDPDSCTDGLIKLFGDRII